MTKQSGRWITVILAVLLLFTASAGAEVIRHEEMSGGKLAAVSWTDADGKPVPGPDGYARVEYTYKNRSAQPTTERYFDENGDPYVTAEGYAKVMKEYGRDYTVTSESFYGADNQPCLCIEGYAEAKYGYTSKGEIRTAYYYDTNGRKVIVPALGYACLNREYKGVTLVSETFLGTDKNPIDAKVGYAVMENTLNRQYDILETRYRHADGSPASGPEGWHHAVYTNDSDGRHLSAQYFTETETPCINAEGVYEQSFTYDSQGRLLTIQLQNNGKPVTGLNGWSKCAYEYDDTGRKTCTRYYDINGKLTDRRSGYAYCVTTWNDAEGSYTQTWYDVNGQALKRDGYMTLVSYTSGHGRIIANRYLDENGKPTQNANGVYTVEYTYDEQGRIIGNRYLDQNGEPAISSEGYAAFTDELDENGFVIRRICNGTDGTVLKTLCYIYDDNLNLTEVIPE